MSPLMREAARLLKPGIRHAVYISERPPVEPSRGAAVRSLRNELRKAEPVKPMATTARQGHYAAQGRLTLTPAQRRRIRKKQHRLLRT